MWKANASFFFPHFNSLCECKCQNLSIYLFVLQLANSYLKYFFKKLTSQIFSREHLKSTAWEYSARDLVFATENSRVKELLSQVSWVTLHYTSITWTLIKKFHLVWTKEVPTGCGCWGFMRVLWQQIICTICSLSISQVQNKFSAFMSK